MSFSSTGCLYFALVPLHARSVDVAYGIFVALDILLATAQGRALSFPRVSAYRSLSCRRIGLTYAIGAAAHFALYGFGSDELLHSDIRLSWNRSS